VVVVSVIVIVVGGDDLFVDFVFLEVLTDGAIVVDFDAVVTFIIVWLLFNGGALSISESTFAPTNNKVLVSSFCLAVVVIGWPLRPLPIIMNPHDRINCVNRIIIVMGRS
jgi:hypothetical protein